MTAFPSADTDRPLAAVAGATGYLGGHVVRALQGEGYRVRALTRDPARLGELRACCDEVFVGEATRPETLAGFCDGCEVAYLGLGIRSARRRPSFWDVDHRANLNVLERAREAGVGHVVFIAAIGADRLRAQGVGPAEARERVVDAVLASGIRCSVLRGTGFFNDMEGFFRMASRGTAWVIGGGATRMNPIHGADLAAEVVRSLSDERYWNRVTARGGPEVFTFHQIMEEAFTALGKKPKIRSVPNWLLAPARVLIRPFNPTLAGFLHAIGAATQLDDLTAPPCGSHRLADFFAELARTGEASSP